MNIVITGTSRGIGYQLVSQFLKEGHRVVAISRNISPLKDEFGENTNLKIISFDLSELKYNVLSSEISRFFRDGIDILINNAGQLINKPFESITAEDLDKSYKTNVYAPILLTQSLVSQFNDSAHIVNISSVGGFQGSVKFPGLLAYSSAKAALVCATECLQEEFRDASWSFNCLCLGAVQTEMLAEAFPDYVAPHSSEQMASYIKSFALSSGAFYKGKILPVSTSTP